MCLINFWSKRVGAYSRLGVWSNRHGTFGSHSIFVALDYATVTGRETITLCFWTSLPLCINGQSTIGDDRFDTHLSKSHALLGDHNVTYHFSCLWRCLRNERWVRRMFVSFATLNRLSVTQQSAEAVSSRNTWVYKTVAALFQFFTT